MDKRQRITLLGIAVAIALVAVVIALVAGGGDDEKNTATTTAEATDTAPQTATTTDTTTETQTEAETPEPEQTRIRVEGGEPVGGTEKIEVGKGNTVRIEVTADAADEAHLHGYDITKAVGPDKPARFSFEADIEGVFELEMHDSSAQLAEITVKP